MDSISFKRASNDNHEEDQTFRRKTRKKLIVITLSATLLISIVVCTSIAVLLPTRGSHTQPGTKPEPYSENLIINMCNTTLYPDPCSSSIASLAKSSNRSAGLDPLEVFKLSLEVSLNELVNLSSKLLDDRGTSLCRTLIDAAIGRVTDCIESMKQVYDVDDIRTWLSAAITDQKTCIYGVTEALNGSRTVEIVTLAMRNSTVFTSNSLAIASKILPILGDLQTPVDRKLLEVGDQLLEENPRPNITVAMDGSGDFETISEALGSVPKRSKARTIIYVKAGIYVENVTVDQWNVMIYGDGMFKTIVSGNKSDTGGILTYFSATFGK